MTTLMVARDAQRNEIESLIEGITDQLLRVATVWHSYHPGQRDRQTARRWAEHAVMAMAPMRLARASGSAATALDDLLRVAHQDTMRDHHELHSAAFVIADALRQQRRICTATKGAGIIASYLAALRLPESGRLA